MTTLTHGNFPPITLVCDATAPANKEPISTTRRSVVMNVITSPKSIAAASPITSPSIAAGADPIFAALDAALAAKAESDRRYAGVSKLYKLAKRHGLGDDSSLDERNKFVESRLGSDPDAYTDETADAYFEAVDEAFTVKPSTIPGVLALLRFARDLPDEDLVKENAVSSLIPMLIEALEALDDPGIEPSLRQSERATFQAKAYRDMEGDVNDLERMGHIAAQLIHECSSNGGDEYRHLELAVFAVDQLSTMAKTFLSRYEAAYHGEEWPI
jgi:hypothetical protein